MSFGETFHTGLRKGLDSRWSVLAWNLVALMPDECYSFFCEDMEGVTSADLKSRCLGWVKARPDRIEHGRTGSRWANNAAWFNMLAATIDLCSDEDWAALVVWFQFCEEGV